MNKKRIETDIQKIAERYINNRSDTNFASLYSRIKYGLRSYIFGIVKNIDDTDDIEVKVLEKVWKNIHMYDPNKAKFSTWLYRIALFESLQYIANRNKSHKHILPEDVSNIYANTIAGTCCNNDDAFITHDNIDYVTENYIDFTEVTKDDITQDLYDASLTCINLLKDQYRMVLYEKLVNCKTIVDIANEKQIPITTVKNWLFKGRIELRNMIKEKFGRLYESYCEFEIN